jgi:hypothetical protein
MQRRKKGNWVCGSDMLGVTSGGIIWSQLTTYSKAFHYFVR